MSLHDAYRAVAEVLGNGIEPFAVTQVVEDLRLRWQPKTTRVIMFAESHVWTTDQELQRKVKLPDGDSTPYVRFVYCLGYGESKIVDGRVAENRGTPQYWTLFHDAVHGPAVERQIVGPARSPTTKLKLLGEMQARGIWLVDASIVALYRGPKIDKRRYREVLARSWRHHIGEVVRSCSPTGILVIGSGVNESLGDVIHKVSNCEVQRVFQPQAHMTRAMRTAWREQIFEFCGRHARRGASASA